VLLVVHLAVLLWAALLVCSLTLFTFTVVHFLLVSFTKIPQIPQSLSSLPFFLLKPSHFTLAAMGGPPKPAVSPPPTSGPPKPAASPPPSAAPAADDRPPNPLGRGNLLAGIQGFKKSGLEKTETVDKSAPPVAGGGAKAGGGGGGGARPTGGGGAGPFGVPAGGLAAIRAQKAAEQSAAQNAPPRMGMFSTFVSLQSSFYPQLLFSSQSKRTKKYSSSLSPPHTRQYQHNQFII